MQRLSNKFFSGAAFSSFAAPGYPILWWAGLFSFISSQMQFLLRGILAWDLTEREGALGLVFLVFGVAMLISTPLGGVASDTLSKRKLLLVTQAMLMGVSVVMGLVVVAGVVQFWMLLASAAIQGTAFGFFGPARVAIAGEIVGREHLGNAISLTLLSMNGTRVFAPALAGVLAGVAAIGIGGAYIVAAVMATVAFLMLLRLPDTSPATDGTLGAATTNGAGNEPAKQKPTVNPFAEILDGIRYVRARPPLRRIVVMSFVVIMFGFNYVSFLPALVEGQYGLSKGWVGGFSSFSALGAVAVSIPVAARADSPDGRKIMIVAGLVFGTGVMALGAAPVVWMALASVALAGLGTTAFQSLSNTIALQLADDAHQGRVQSLMMLAFAGFGIAAFPLGALAELVGIQTAIVGMGLVTAGAVVVYVVLEGGRKAFAPVSRLENPPLSPEVLDFNGSKDKRQVTAAA